MGNGDVSNSSNSTIDQEYEKIIDDTTLSNVELSNKISMLSSRWEDEATKAFNDLLNSFDKGDKNALNEYWKSRDETDQLKMALFEVLVKKKYGSGSIGGVEMAKLEYQLKKQKALDIGNINDYLTN